MSCQKYVLTLPFVFHTKLQFFHGFGLSQLLCDVKLPLCVQYCLIFIQRFFFLKNTTFHTLEVQNGDLYFLVLHQNGAYEFLLSLLIKLLSFRLSCALTICDDACSLLFSLIQFSFSNIFRKIAYPLVQSVPLPLQLDYTLKSVSPPS